MATLPFDRGLYLTKVVDYYESDGHTERYAVAALSGVAGAPTRAGWRGGAGTTCALGTGGFRGPAGAGARLAGWAWWGVLFERGLSRSFRIPAGEPGSLGTVRRTVAGTLIYTPPWYHKWR